MRKKKELPYYAGCMASKENPYRWKIDPSQFTEASIKEFKYQERRDNDPVIQICRCFKKTTNFIVRLITRFKC